MRSSVCVFILLLAATTFAHAQSPSPKKPRTPEDYYPRTLRDLNTLLPKALADGLAELNRTEEPDVLVQADILPSRVKVVYAGASRPLPESKKSLILSWANRFAGMPEFYTVPYQTETLFTESGENYWLAVRKEFLPKFEQDLKKGDEVELFVIKMGSIKLEQTDPNMSPVLLVERFVKQ